jgi:SAM-dependent methyltransferase
MVVIMVGMSGVRDYLAWHELYDDPDSSLPRRLGLVREVLRGELDARPGPVRVLSLCAGDGRDILGVLAERQDAARVSVTLVEVLPELVERAGNAAAGLAADVQVVAADAGSSETYVGLATVPADVVLLVGVLGNLSDADVATTVAEMPRLCASGATLLWSRGRSLEGDDDFVTPVREAFAAAGFAEVSIRSFDVEDDRTALGVVRYDGPPVRLEPPERWFTFVG